MKKSQLKNIIKEEIKSTLKEADWDDLPGIAKAVAEEENAMNIAVTIANTAAGIMGALAPIAAGGLGPIFGPPMAKMYAVMGALQLAVIARTSYGGGGASAPEAPAMTGLKIGGRGSSVDTSKGGNAGELSYLRGARGVGSNANEFTPGGAMGRKGYANGGNDIVVGVLVLWRAWG